MIRLVLNTEMCPENFFSRDFALLRAQKVENSKQNFFFMSLEIVLIIMKLKLGFEWWTQFKLFFLQKGHGHKKLCLCIAPEFLEWQQGYFYNKKTFWVPKRYLKKEQLRIVVYSCFDNVDMQPLQPNDINGFRNFYDKRFEQ